MKYVILAAGLGSRLAPYTDDRHKALVHYKGKGILFHFLDHLEEGDEVALIVGHMKEQVMAAVKERYPNMNISFVHNDKYLEEGTAYSLAQATEHMKGGFVYANCDLVPDPRMFDDLKKADNVMFVDRRVPFRNTLMKLSPEAVNTLFEMGYAPKERAYDWFFKVMGNHSFHTVDISNYDWREIDEPSDME